MPEDLNDIFPNLPWYRITSPPSIQYNCIAWALSITNQWWSHDRTWPDSVPRSTQLDALQQLFETIGYTICENSQLEPGYEKIAIYAQNGEWTHAARQLPNGHWTSKLGPYEDITHPTPESLTGNIYGNPQTIMRRPSPAP